MAKVSYVDTSNLSLVLEEDTYSYGKNGNIISETIINNYSVKQEEKVNETRTYIYDSLNRMITSKRTDNTNQMVSNASYTYDKVGNCIRIVEDGVTRDDTEGVFGWFHDALSKVAGFLRRVQLWK